MGIIRFMWRWILRPLLALVFAQALRKIGMAYGFSPEDWIVEAVLGTSTETLWPGVIGWIMVAVIAALILWFFEWRRKHMLETASSILPEKQPDKQPEEPENIDATESLLRSNLNVERESGRALIEQSMALSDITEVGKWTPRLFYVSENGDVELDLDKADGRYKMLGDYWTIDCRLEFVLPNLPDSTKVAIAGLPFTINSKIRGIHIECESLNMPPNRATTFRGYAFGGTQVMFHITPHDLLSGEACYLQFKIDNTFGDLDGYR